MAHRHRGPQIGGGGRRGAPKDGEHRSYGLGAVVDAMADEIGPTYAAFVALQGLAKPDGELTDVVPHRVGGRDRLREGAADLDQLRWADGLDQLAAPARRLIHATA